MLLHSPLRTITASLDADVLGILARHDQSFTVPQLNAMISSRSTEGIRKTLRRLVTQGVVDVESVGRTQLFRLNREHLAAPLIVQLADLRGNFITNLANDMLNWTSPPVFAALFGSAARGDMTPSSDIDLFLLRDEGVDPEEFAEHASRLTERASRWSGNDVRALIYGLDEVQSSPGAKSVLQRIAKEGEAIVGNREMFHTMVSDR